MDKNVYRGQMDKYIYEYGTQGGQLFFARLCDKYSVSKKDRYVANRILDRLTKALLEYSTDKGQE